MKLTDDERSELAVLLADSVSIVDAEVERAWVAEALERLEDIRAGRAKTTPTEVVEERLEAIIASYEAKRAAG